MNFLLVHAYIAEALKILRCAYDARDVIEDLRVIEVQ
jgi:hypothetical protein